MFTCGSFVSGINAVVSAGDNLVTLYGMVPHATGIKGFTSPITDNAIIQTLGHSVSGSGPGTYYYHANSTTTPNSGTVFFGPNGSGRIHFIGDAYVVDVTKFGAVGNGSTDDTAAINRAIAYASGITNSYSHPLLYFPPGRRYVISRLEVPRLIDIDMTGSTLFSASTSYDKPILQIGSSGNGYFGTNFASKFKGLHVEYNGSPSTHGYPESGRNDYFGIRIINALDCKIEVLEVNGFYGGIQLLGSGTTADTPCAHNTLTIGSIFDCKIGLDLRAYERGYANENLIHNGNFQTSTTNITNYGSAYGIRFSRAGTSHYSGQNNNVFNKPCFQLGNWKLTWSAGISIGSNYRVYYNGNEYLALNTGTTGATPPTHTSGSASDGTINWQYVGPYRRTPVYHEDAGALNRFIGSRWEGAIGSFALVSGTGVQGPSVYEYEWYDLIDSGNAVRQIEDIENARSFTVNSAQSFMLQGKDIIRPQSIGINNLHYRSVCGASGWTVAGLGFHNFWTGAFRTYTSGQMKLCRDSLYIDCYSNPMSGFTTVQVADLLSCVVDIQQNRRFRIDRQIGGGLATPLSNGGRTGRVYLAPLNDSFTAMDLQTSSVANIPVLLAADQAMSVPSASVEMIRTGIDSAVNLGVVANHTVPYVLVGFFDMQLEGFTITKVMETFPYLRSNDISVLSMDMIFGDTQRSSVGTPRWGFFCKRGEIILNHMASAGNPAYWVVTTPGILAPTFNSGASIVKGELRQNGSNVYAANSAGTAGNSPPTGTGSAISDGTLTWDYLGTTATLTPGPNL